VVQAARCDQSKEELRAALGLENIPTAVTIGQFIPRKGFDVLLNAWKDVPQPAQLVLVGGGDLEEEYRRQIRDLNLENVHLVGFVGKETVFQYYHASDLFVLPTREDIWGLVINEAMASGLPVVGTDRCIAAVELIEDGQNGYVVPIEDASALSQSMNAILSDPELAARMRSQNLDKIRSFTLENIVENHRRVIDKL
ncbi:MAG: glycosyltransferase family 4 protein, partial [Lachnospiraceae bacterium]|nr:glycosyltransferase family 4 protein [Lachnospiraceae bacterium]